MKRIAKWLNNDCFSMNCAVKMSLLLATCHFLANKVNLHNHELKRHEEIHEEILVKLPRSQNFLHTFVVVNLNVRICIKNVIIKV